MEQVVDLHVSHLGFQARVQLEDGLGALAGVRGGFVDRRLRRLDLLAPHPQQLVGAHQRHAQQLTGQVVQPRVAGAGPQ